MEPLPRAPWPRGCLQVYTGDGKGKTTAALGLALRAVGRGLRVYVGQFMKGVPYGELAAAEALEGRLVVEQFGGTGHQVAGREPAPAEVERARRGLARVLAVLHGGDHQVVVLDEVCVALVYGLLREEDLLAVLDGRPGGVEVVCTGRHAPPSLLDRADLVTEMRDLRHPWTTGLGPRDGIER